MASLLYVQEDFFQPRYEENKKDGNSKGRWPSKRKDPQKQGKDYRKSVKYDCYAQPFIEQLESLKQESIIYEY